MLDLYQIINGKKATCCITKFALTKEINHNDLEVGCKYPFTMLDVKLKNGQEISIDSQAVMNYSRLGNEWIMDG